MILGVDFDGSCTVDSFPRVGDSLPGAVETLRWLNSKGVKIILYTMRSHQQGLNQETGELEEVKEGMTSVLQDAINWFNENGITLWAVNYNPEQTWSNSRKVYANYYIDDRALGTPLTKDGYVDWTRMRVLLEKIVGT